MSLISDALKKAQRQRTGPDTVPPIPGVGRAARPEPSSQSMIGIIAGAVGLVVLAVGLTIFFLRSKAPAPVPTPVVSSLAAAKAVTAPPAITAAMPATAPVIAAPLPAAARPPVPPPVVINPTPASPIVAAPVAKEPVPADTTAPSGQPVTTKRTRNADPDPRIIAFVDAIRVTGIRSSGSESKVLMNDKVFRVNDIVDRMLNVRLTAVETDSLTFIDENGVGYTKNF